jgi:hypothetical protein
MRHDVALYEISSGCQWDSWRVRGQSGRNDADIVLQPLPPDAVGRAERSNFEGIFKTIRRCFEKASHFLQEDEGERIAEVIRVFCKGQPIK